MPYLCAFSKHHTHCVVGFYWLHSPARAIFSLSICQSDPLSMSHSLLIQMCFKQISSWFVQLSTVSFFPLYIPLSFLQNVFLFKS